MRIKQVKTECDFLKQEYAKLRKTKKNMFTSKEMKAIKEKIKEKLNLPADTLQKSGRKTGEEKLYMTEGGFYGVDKTYPTPLTRNNQSPIPLNQKEIKSLYDDLGDPISTEVMLKNELLSVPVNSIRFSKYPNGSSHVFQTRVEDGIKITRMGAKGFPTLIITEEPSRVAENGLVAVQTTVGKYMHLNKSPFKTITTVKKKYERHGEETFKLLSKEITFRKPSDDVPSVIRLFNINKGNQMLVVEDANGKSTRYHIPKQIEEFISKQDKQVQEQLKM